MSPPSNPSRRTVLGVSSALLAGLAGQIGLRNTDTGRQPSHIPEPSEDESPTPRATTTADKTPTRHRGETIPTVPIEVASRVPPVEPEPPEDVENPVLTAADVTDFGDVDYVADPFLFVEEGTWHMFFEVLNRDRDPDAVIGHATSNEGVVWEYDQVARREDAHTSFPLVWKWADEYYMVSPTGRNVSLYTASSFPTEWEFAFTIDMAPFGFSDVYAHDPVFFRWADRWWLLTDRGDDIVAFYNDELAAAGWTPHPSNPLVSGEETAQNAGRAIVSPDSIYLFFQDHVQEYGDKVRAYRVTELSTESVSLHEVSQSPILEQSGSGWRSHTMHHYDPWYRGEGKGWRCAVDGENIDRGYSIGVFDIPEMDSKTRDTAASSTNNP